MGRPSIGLWAFSMQVNHFTQLAIFVFREMMSNESALKNKEATGLALQRATVKKGKGADGID